jgi:predicted anti-sigma-YlaC factor YlaD
MAIAVSEWSCARVRRALSLVLDGETATGDFHSLATHVGGCPACRRHVSEISAITKQLRSARVELQIDSRHTTARRENGHG